MGIPRWRNMTGHEVIIHDVDNTQLHLCPGDVVVGEFFRHQSPPLTYLDNDGTGIDLTTNRGVGRVLGGSGGVGTTDDKFAVVIERPRDPDITDYLYEPGTLWINVSTEDSFILKTSQNKSANWQYIGDSGVGSITEIDGGGFI